MTIPLEGWALIFAVFGTIVNFWYSAHNKRLMDKQFELQFLSDVQLIIPKTQYIVNEADFRLIVRNAGTLPLGGGGTGVPVVV